MLCLERAFEGGPSFSAGDIIDEVWKFRGNRRAGRPAKDVHHQQVAGAEITIQPVRTAEPVGQLAEPATNAAFDQR